MKAKRYLWCGLSVALSVCGGCGRDSEKAAATEDSPKPMPAFTAAEILGNPNILHDRLLADNPAYAGGAQVAKDLQVGLVGQINTKTVSSLSGLRGLPFGGAGAT